MIFPRLLGLNIYQVTCFRQPQKNLDLQKNIQISMSVLRQALDKYGFGGISISFNGGKDALVMLILYFYTLRQYSSEKEGIKMKRIPAIYIQNPYPFSEIEYFVKKCSENYVLDLVYKKSPMKTALKEYLDEYPEIKAVLVGSRRSDPGCSMLKHFDPTDFDWPYCIRVHPIIDWCYSNIWEFLKDLNIEYCSLYDQGYTSIGGTQDTFRNPELQLDHDRFRPAYELIDGHKERLGRKYPLKNY
ncbi:hypothetical protein MERGE_001166 [Pneumocystis wakefieldiae]|uniref:FAD synthase n=1 Tax=Pneumocystis wakefieldiae TaxID=38082 RepID=A0A899FSC6_9ASCO|nr:hypothetical protein MERGE_001166 [Pneumocystis wakefieldiae]